MSYTGTMTPDQIAPGKDTQELRDWSARKMGWTEQEAPFVFKCWYEDSNGEITVPISKWQPDLDLNQAFMLVERMRELGFNFELYIWDGLIENKVRFFRFTDGTIAIQKGFPAADLGKYILLAGYQTEAGRTTEVEG